MKDKNTAATIKECENKENRPPRSPIDRLIADTTGILPEELTGEALEKWQLEEIRRVLAYCSKSRYYKRLLCGSTENQEPEELPGSFDDFRKLPLTGETDLAGHENDFLCMQPGDVKRMVSVPTTGTTGGRKRLAFSEGDLQRAQEFIRVAYTTFAEPGDRMIVMMSGGTPGSIGDVVIRSMQDLGVEVLVSGPVTDIRDAFRTILEWKPDIITGIPVQTAALARYGELQGYNKEDLGIREVLLSADDAPDSIRKRLKDTWGARTFRHYGMTELCIAGGCECCADDGYHIRSNDHYFEVASPDEEGFGEIVVTTFHHEAMPLIRYRTGDIGQIDRSPCPCGSLLPRLKNVRGRISNSVPCGNGRLFLRDLEEVLFLDPAVTDFECEAETGEKGSADQLQILLKHFPGDIPDVPAIKKQVKELPVLRDTRILMSRQEMEAFPSQYNPKKKMNRVSSPAPRSD